MSENKTENKKWNEVMDGHINVPDHLMPIFNKIGMQINFLQISGKNEIKTICDIISICEDFFTKPLYQKNETFYIKGSSGTKTVEAGGCINLKMPNKMETKCTCCCNCKDSISTTSIHCCNICGKSTESFWCAKDNYLTKLAIALRALQDIKRWDDDLEDEFGDPGYRADYALKLLKQLDQ